MVAWLESELSMTSRATGIIKTLYGEEVQRTARNGLLAWPPFCKPTVVLRPGSRTYQLLRRRRRLTNLFRTLLAVGGVFCVVAFCLGVYYFNLLTSLEQNVQMGWARIDSLLMRRHNISTNLARTVRDYAIHEQGVLTHVSSIRAAAQGDNEQEQGQVAAKAAPPSGLAEKKNAPGQGAEKPPREAKPPDVAAKDNELKRIISLVEGSSPETVDLGKQLGGFKALAEQYPDLKLSANFIRFMDALVESEKDLANERLTYAATVNTYTTTIACIPGRWYAKLYRFHGYPYYEIADDAKHFRPVDY